MRRSIFESGPSADNVMCVLVESGISGVEGFGISSSIYGTVVQDTEKAGAKREDRASAKTNLGKGWSGRLPVLCDRCRVHRPVRFLKNSIAPANLKQGKWNAKTFQIPSADSCLSAFNISFETRLRNKKRERIRLDAFPSKDIRLILCAEIVVKYILNRDSKRIKEFVD